MRTAMFVFLAIGSLAIAYATITQIYILLWKPERYAIQREVSDRWNRLQHYRYYGLLFGCFVGLCFMVFKGVEGALWFVPRGWVIENDEGEREWIVHGLAFTSAFLLSGFILEKLGSLAAESVGRNSR